MARTSRSPFPLGTSPTTRHDGQVAGKHVFVSYVREDNVAVDGLCAVLEAAKIPYWRDRSALGPDDAWRARIRDAIRSGSLVFLACFSENSQHFGRPGTPTDQTWIESLNGHIKIDYPHLLAIRDPATLGAELAVVRAHYNGVRLHQGIGYVTPDDEHEGRGEATRKARQAGLEQARESRPAS